MLVEDLGLCVGGACSLRGFGGIGRICMMCEWGIRAGERDRDGECDDRVYDFFSSSYWDGVWCFLRFYFGYAFVMIFYGYG